MEEQTKAEETVSLKKSTMWMIVSSILGILLIVSIFTGGFGYGNDGSGGTVQVTGNAVGNQPSGDGGLPGKVDVSADDDPFIGDKNAPVTVIEFSDFQCPFCERLYQQAEKQLISDYVDTGKIRFVYRDFPLTSIHPDAQKAAEAAECADEQGKFWEYHNMLFEKQAEWSGVGVTRFKQYAADLKLDTKKFNDCLDTGKYEDEVNKDANDAVSAGARGTPATFVNGILVSGAQPYANFKQVIDAELAKAS